MRVSLPLILFLLLAAGCMPTMTTTLSGTATPLPADANIAYLNIPDAIPAGAKMIGYSNFGDSGVSTDCGFDSNLKRAATKARTIGANIVKVTEDKKPGIMSTCHRMHIEYYAYDGDVTTLSQYLIGTK